MCVLCFGFTGFCYLLLPTCKAVLIGSKKRCTNKTLFICITFFKYMVIESLDICSLLYFVVVFHILLVVVFIMKTYYAHKKKDGRRRRSYCENYYSPLR